MSKLDYKVIKKKKLDQNTNLKVFKHEATERVLVEFSSDICKMVIQKSFQDTYEGRLAAEDFQKTIKSTDDLKRYFGIAV